MNAIGAVLGIAVMLQDPNAPLIAGRDVPPPEKVRQVRPEFPAIAMRATPPIEGVVMLQLTIDEAGQPVEIGIASGRPLLNEAAMAAARGWAYAPTLVEGKPVRVIVREAVDFFLSEQSAERHFARLVGSEKTERSQRLFAIQRLASGRHSVVGRNALERASRSPDEQVRAAAAAALVRW